MPEGAGCGAGCGLGCGVGDDWAGVEGLGLGVNAGLGTGRGPGGGDDGAGDCPGEGDLAGEGLRGLNQFRMSDRDCRAGPAEDGLDCGTDAGEGWTAGAGCGAGLAGWDGDFADVGVVSAPHSWPRSRFVDC